MLALFIYSSCEREVYIYLCMSWVVCFWFVGVYNFFFFKFFWNKDLLFQYRKLSMRFQFVEMMSRWMCDDSLNYSCLWCYSADILCLHLILVITLALLEECQQWVSLLLFVLRETWDRNGKDSKIFSIRYMNSEIIFPVFWVQIIMILLECILTLKLFLLFWSVCLI